MRGDELTPWLIRYAYSEGAFPMTMDDGSVEWFQPVNRALFPISGIHLSRSMKKEISRITNNESQFTVTFDTAFEQVMRGCLRPDDNWISEEFIRVYTQIHLEGWGHSVEVWRSTGLPPVNEQFTSASSSAGTPMLRPDEQQLVGGLYGIAIGSCFCAESMFHRETNASKVALWAMVQKCRSLGFTIFDAQVMNSHLESLGAYPVPNNEYLELLRTALRRRTPWSLP